MVQETGGAMAETETFGERLRRLREQRGLSLDELAARTEISKAYLWKLEKKPDSNPSIDIAQKLAEALGTTLGKLAEAPTLAGATEIPESLRKAADRFNIAEADLSDLARISFRGARPTTEQEWGLLYLQLRQLMDRNG